MATQAAKRPLPPRTLRFIDEYILEPNGTRAATLAGYSPHTAEEQASRLLSNVRVRREVEAKRQRLAARTEITQNEIAGYLRRDATVGDPTEPNSARVQAALGLAKLGGLITERVKVETPPAQVNLYLMEMPLSELLELRDAMRKKLEKEA